MINFGESARLADLTIRLVVKAISMSAKRDCYPYLGFKINNEINNSDVNHSTSQAWRHTTEFQLEKRKLCFL